MSIKQPYRRTCRQMLDGSYGGGQYIKHQGYADDPYHYIRAFLLIQQDLRQLFEYVEPADENLKCYSHRIHQLLIRSCIEIEANCKAILFANGYPDNGSLSMSDYKKLESSHRLSKYEIRLHFWRGRVLTTVPFCAWKNNGALTWYQSYNMTKHNRHKQFKEANFENMIDAVCGLLALLSSQFINDSFSGGPAHLVVRGGAGGGFEVAIGDFFHVKFPDDWPEDERYDFNWSNLKGEEDPFQNYPYPV